LDDNQDIAQSAAGMVRMHGENALAQVYLVVARMMRKKDKEGEALWRAIAKIIEDRRSS